MADVYRDAGDDHIRLWAGEYDESERLTVAHAREIAGKLLEHADAIDAEVAASRALCEAQGHDWDGSNYWTRPPGGHTANRKVFIETCRRLHCDAKRTSEGWREEAGDA